MSPGAFGTKRLGPSSRSGCGRSIISPNPAITRPVIANDGWEFVVGDAFTLHLYQQTGEALEQALDRLIDDPVSPIADSPGARVGAIDTASLARIFPF